MNQQEMDSIDSMCTTERSITNDDGTWLLIIKDDEKLNPADFEKLKNSISSIFINNGMIYMKRRFRVEFILTSGIAIVGQRVEEKDKKDKNNIIYKEFKNFDDIIYTKDRSCVSLGWKDAMYAMLLGAINVCTNAMEKEFVGSRLDCFEKAMKGLEEKRESYKMFSMRCFNATCKDHPNLCDEFWAKSSNDTLKELKQNMIDDCHKVCIFYKKGVTEEDPIPKGLFAKPKQFSADYSNQLRGVPYTYNWRQLVNVGTEEAKFPQCLIYPHITNLYDAKKKEFHKKQIVYCRVIPAGVFISDPFNMRLMTQMCELLYDGQVKKQNARLDIGDQYLSIHEYEKQANNKRMNDAGDDDDKENKFPKYE